MKILITGAHGQVGYALQRAVPPGYKVKACARAELDITDPDAVHRVVQTYRPDWIINAAAYTAVDRAERDAALAYAINDEGTANLACAARETGSRLLHISTDFVFAGDVSRPLTPDDPPAPKGAYGASKLAGEKAVARVLGDAGTVVRSSWIFSARPGNFLTTMLRLMRERDELSVVNDQVGSPTSATVLAQALWQMVQGNVQGGLYHCACAGAVSWYEFANAIYADARARGLLDREVTIRPISTRAYGAPAPRPAYSVLDCTAAKQRFAFDAPSWRDALGLELDWLGEHRPDSGKSR